MDSETGEREIQARRKGMKERNLENRKKERER